MINILNYFFFAWVTVILFRTNLFGEIKDDILRFFMLGTLEIVKNSIEHKVSYNTIKLKK